VARVARVVLSLWISRSVWAWDGIFACLRFSCVFSLVVLKVKKRELYEIIFRAVYIKELQMICL